MTLRMQQNFGSGGSTTVSVAQSTVALTTSWALKTVEIDFDSLSGKTIGTASYLALQMYFLSGIGAITIDIADVQLEPVDTTTPKPSPFERLPIAIQTALNRRY